MTSRELAVPGAWEITPPLHTDSRGELFEWFTNAEFTALAGHRFDLRQAKSVGCPRGKVLDVIVDIRVGSPTFGRWDSVVLDDDAHRSVYISEGLGHAFLALEDDSTLKHLSSAPYNPEREHTINALDPALDIAWPTIDGAPIMSERDRKAPTLTQAEAAGPLPTWHETQAFIAGQRDPGCHGDAHVVSRHTQ